MALGLSSQSEFALIGKVVPVGGLLGVTRGVEGVDIDSPDRFPSFTTGLTVG